MREGSEIIRRIKATLSLQGLSFALLQFYLHRFRFLSKFATYSVHTYCTLSALRGLISFTHVAWRTKNIHPKCFSWSITNFNWSDRNFCAISLLEFVSKRLCIETTDFPYTLGSLPFGKVQNFHFRRGRLTKNEKYKCFFSLWDKGVILYWM